MFHDEKSSFALDGDACFSLDSSRLARLGLSARSWQWDLSPTGRRTRSALDSDLSVNGCFLHASPTGDLEV